MKKIYFLILGILLLAGCAQNQDKEFKDMCQKAGYEWMYMKPTQDGKIMKGMETCWGCMVEGVEHVCSIEKYNEMTKSGPDTDVSLKTIPGNLSALQPAILSFSIKDLEGNPLRPTRAHEKLFHTIIISEDFSIFSHIHPEDSKLTTKDMIEKGEFSIDYNFKRAGKYLIGADFEASNKDFAKNFIVEVSGIPKQGTFAKDFAREKTFDGYDVKLAYQGLKAGEESMLTYHFEKEDKPLTGMQQYLGAPMHLAIVKSDLSNFMHTHGMAGSGMEHSMMQHDEPKSFGPEVHSQVIFPEKGIYQIFGEFKHSEKVVVTSFMVEVK